MMHRSISLVFAFMVPSLALADNWPGWRGPHNQGISAEKDLPASWSKTKNVRWKVKLAGAGVSNPVVWEDRVFLTASDGRLNDRLHVYCYHRAGGKLLWHTRLFGSAPTDHFALGGMAIPTPCTDGKLLYLLFGTGELAALDLEGKPAWIRSLAEEYGPFRNRWGMGTSPILLGDMLIVLVDHYSQSYLLGIETRTGANRWKVDRPTAVNWTSPLAVRVKDRTEIVTCGTNHVRSYDAKDGKELWSVDGLGFQCIPSPVAAGDMLFVSSGESTMAIKLDGSQGDLTKSRVEWKNKKAKAFLPSPLAYEGLLYLPEEKYFVTCYHTASGKQVWRERLGDTFHASPVAGAGMIYITSREGVVRVVRSSATFELLAENDMGETIIASPALSNGQIFLRGEKHLFCIGGKDQ